MRVPTKCATSKKIKNPSETVMGMVKPKRHYRHKKADIVAEQNLVVQSNATEEVINVGKSVTVKATFNS